MLVSTTTRVTDWMDRNNEVEAPPTTHLGGPQ
jgi:hypothetical protein